MKTFSELLRAEASEIEAETDELFLKHSRLVPERLPSSNFDNGIVVIHMTGNRFWEDLDTDGVRLQSKILERYNHFRNTVSTLLKHCASAIRSKFESADSKITRLVEHKNTWCDSPAAAASEVRTEIASLLTIIDELPSAGEEAVVIPDTNALINSPDIEKWHFDWADRFTIVLTPTVLGEIDKLKITHNNQAVRETAKSLNRRFKEYMSRGSLHLGVPIVKGKITLRSLAVEPRPEDSFSWLDFNHQDDRFLASAVEVLRAHVRSPGALVTSDINLMNKAQYARIPFVDPPDAAGC